VIEASRHLRRRVLSVQLVRADACRWCWFLQAGLCRTLMSVAAAFILISAIGRLLSEGQEACGLQQSGSRSDMLQLH
jgi:hypothetical protein